MNEFVGPMEILAGGFGALLGPGMALSSAVVFVVGLAFSRRRAATGHLVCAAVLAVLFATATARRGLSEPGSAAFLVALGILLVLSWLVTRHEEARWSWPALLTGLLLATLAVQWRMDSYGPVLGVLRGSWQTPPDRAALLLYHLATGIGLAGLHLLGVALGRRLPSRAGIAVVWGLSVGAGALMWTGGWSEVVRVLLLRWPHLAVG